jgi:hypothetical protein
MPQYGTDMDLIPGSHTEGFLTIGDLSVPYGSGGSGRGSIPYGTWPVNDDYVPRTRLGLQGWAVNNPQGIMDDPRYEGGRSDIMIHLDVGSKVADKIITAGCIGIEEQYWPEFRTALQKMQEEHGTVILKVTPNGAVIYPEGQEPPGVFVDADQFIAESRMQTTALQTFLRDRGYDPGPIDGVPGPLTKAAVEQFQTDYALPATGEVTPETVTAMRSQGLGANPEQASSKRWFTPEVTGRLGPPPMPEGAGKPPPPFRPTADTPIIPQGAGKPPPPTRQQQPITVTPQGASKPPPPARTPVPVAQDPRFAPQGSEYPSNAEMVRDPSWRPQLPVPNKGVQEAAAELTKAALQGSMDDISMASGKLMWGVAMAGDEAAQAAAAGEISDYFQQVAQTTPYALQIRDRLNANPGLAEAIPDIDGSRAMIVNALSNVPDPSIAATPAFARAMAEYRPNTPSSPRTGATPPPTPPPAATRTAQQLRYNGHTAATGSAPGGEQAPAASPRDPTPATVTCPLPSRCAAAGYTRLSIPRHAGSDRL